MIYIILLNAFLMVSFAYLGLDSWMDKRSTKWIKVYGGFLLFMAGVSLAMYCSNVDKMFG